MKTYTANTAIRHGTNEKDLTDYAPGDAIRLDDKCAEPLLASGDISGPLDPAPEAVVKAEAKGKK